MRFFISGDFQIRNDFCLSTGFAEDFTDNCKISGVFALPEKLQKAAEYYINCNYASVNLNKTEVANALSVSISTLTRAFERCSGYSFVEYLTFVRLNKAKQLLISGKYRVSEVAQLCGFADAGYFSRI